MTNLPEEWAFNIFIMGKITNRTLSTSNLAGFPPVQHSVALESYLEETRVLLVEVQLSKPKNNLSHNEQRELKMLGENTEINLKKANKGTRTVVLNTADKILEGQVQLDNSEHYRPLLRPMVKTRP